MDDTSETWPETKRKRLPDRDRVWRDISPGAFKERQREKCRARGDAPWDYDFDDNRSGWICRPFRLMKLQAITLVILLIVAYFIHMEAPYYSAYGAIILIGYDLLVIYWMVKVGAILFHAMRAGSTSLLYAHFPYYLGEPLKALWLSQRRYSRPDHFVFILRCVQTKWNNSDPSFAELYQCWADKLVVPNCPAGGSVTKVPVEFQLPYGVPTTRLYDDHPYHWEIEVSIQRRKVEILGYYLVPVYEKGWKRQPVGGEAEQ